WIGVVLSVFMIAALFLKKIKQKGLLLGAALVLVVTVGTGAFSLRNNVAFENAFLHTDHRSTSSVSSNQDHVSAFKNGVRDVIHEPLGQGPGTAGPASVYNSKDAR